MNDKYKSTSLNYVFLVKSLGGLLLSFSLLLSHSIAFADQMASSCEDFQFKPVDDSVIFSIDEINKITKISIVFCNDVKNNSDFLGKAEAILDAVPNFVYLCDGKNAKSDKLDAESNDMIAAVELFCLKSSNDPDNLPKYFKEFQANYFCSTEKGKYHSGGTHALGHVDEGLLPSVDKLRQVIVKQCEQVKKGLVSTDEARIYINKAVRNAEDHYFGELGSGVVNGVTDNAMSLGTLLVWVLGVIGSVVAILLGIDKLLRKN